VVKKYAIFLSILVGFAWIMKFPGYSSETGGDRPFKSISRDSFYQFQFKNPFARAGEPIRLDRRLSASQDIHWIRSYGTDGNDYIYSIKQTRDGGSLAAGMTYKGANGGIDAVLLKLNSEGSIEWKKSYGGGTTDGWWNVSFTETADGGYVLATDTESFGVGKKDVWLLKLSSDGNIVWQKTYGKADTYDDARGGIQQTHDGGYVLVGGSQAVMNSLDGDLLILKVDANGNLQWDRIYKDFRIQVGDSFEQTLGGGFIVGASAFGHYGVSDMFHPLILKLDANGDIEWQKLYEGYGRSWDYYTIVQPTRDGGYFVADYVDPTGTGNEDFWIFKLDSAGNILWQNLYGGSGWDRIGRALCQMRDGGYAVAGFTNSYGRGSFDGWILKLDPNGNIVWQKTYGDNFPEVLFSLHQKSNGELLAAGYSSRESDEMLVLNVSEEGEIGGSCEWVMNSSAVAKPTFVVPVNTGLSLINAGLISDISSSSASDIGLVQELLCWNLHQPPVNLSLKTEMNRSLFVKEFYNILSWQPNSQNDPFTINEYKIYRRISGHPYEHIKTVPGNTLEYMELIPATGEVIEYALASVDSEGRESPKSLPVKSS